MNKCEYEYRDHDRYGTDVKNQNNQETAFAVHATLAQQ